MRTRDVTIPLGLWICAAICAHFFFGTGGLVVAKVHDDRSELWKLSREASNLAQQIGQTFEVSLGDPSEAPTEPAPPPPPPVAAAQPKPPPMTRAPKPVAEPPKPEPKSLEKRVAVVEKKADEKPPVHLDPLKDRRIAVVQHAKANQEENPTAHYIADQANHVNEETRATQTSHDRDDDHPTPGANHASNDRSPGDSESTRIAEAEEHKGEHNHAPGERGTDLDVQHEPRLPKPEPRPVSPVATATQPNALPSLRNATNESRPASPQAPPNAPQPTVGGATPPSPEVESASGGNWSFNPARQGGSAGAAQQPTAGGSAPNIPGGRLWSLPGLGQSSAPGTMNTNLNQAQVAFVVGSDNLRKLREADGERRKSEHRGSWTASNFDRWRSAIENYVSSVKPGNQTALNTASSPFGTYLNGMHNRIHPIFAEAFLGWLAGLPADHPMNDHHLVTELEIVLTKEGRLKRMGVVKTSGITAFDIGALEAVDRAQPFGPAPDAIVSADGNVYLHWEFHRDEVFACSTMGAAPFLLDKRTLEHEAPPAVPTAPAPGPANERGAPALGPSDSRQGVVVPPPSGARSS